ncbi:MAG: hypothetical protein IJ449_03545 [Clostridia bacterium]|nr:hypothetical protein [Clostridia bacterium]
MKHPATRISALFLALLLTGSLAACNRAEDSEDDSLSVIEPVAVDHVWKSEYINFPDGVSGSISDAVLNGDTLTFTGRHVITEDPYEVEDVTITFNITDRTFSYEVLDTGADDSLSPREQAEKLYSYTQNTAAYEDGTMEVICTYNEETGTEYYELVRKSADGSVVWNLDLQAQFQNSTNRGWFYINYFMVNSATGTVYVSTDQSIVALDGDGNRLYELTVENHINDMFRAGDGTIYVSAYERNADTGNYGMMFRPLDDVSKGFGTPLDIPDTVDILNADLYTVPEYDLMYSNDIGLYGWNFEDAEPTYLCNWVNSDLTSQDVSGLFAVSGELVLRRDSDPVTGKAQIAVMTPVPPEEVTPKYLIEIAYADNGSLPLQEYAVAFNRSSDTYRVVLEDYNQKSSADGTIADILNQEIIAGDVPDIIVESGSFDTDNLAAKGLFLDLYTYMDAEGAAVTRDDFVPCVLAPMEANDGTLPMLVTDFSLHTIYAKASVVGEKSVWSIDDIVSLSESLSDGQYLFSMYLNSGDPENARDAKMQLLQLLLPYSLSGFIDGATCTFDDGRFAKLLEFCNTCPVLDTSTVENGTSSLFRDGTLVLREETWLSDVSGYLQTKYYQFGGEDMAVIGYPTADPDAVSGTVVSPEVKYGITKDSPVADGAWEFLVSTFGDLEDGYFYHRHTFPSARSALENLFEEEERSYYVFRENGYSGTSVGEGEEFNLEDHPWIQQEIDEGGVFGHMTEEDRAELMAIFETATLVADSDTEILDLIREDVSAYFAGAKTLEETVDIVQSRVSIYVSETRG